MLQHTPSRVARIGDRIVARWHVVLSVVSRPLVTIQILYRDLSPLPRTVSSRILRRIAALLHCIVTQRSPHSATIQNFVSQPPLARPCARVLCHRPYAQAGRVVPYIVALPSRVVGMAFPYRGPCSCAQLLCVTIQSIVS